MKAMLQMGKMEIEGLRPAYARLPPALRTPSPSVSSIRVLYSSA
jgi:hypothetical protein